MTHEVAKTPADSAAGHYLGVDVGGTNIKLGIVDDRGQVVVSGSFPTQQHLGPAHAMEQVRLQAAEMLTKAGLSPGSLWAAGLGTPGSMDIAAGLILEPANLPGWRHFPVRDDLARRLQIPVFFTNDANAAAFGEYWAGAGSQYSSLVFFTLGTGVGGGIIIDDFSIEGSHSLGAELGHVHVDFSEAALPCSCGQTGHLEAYASATGLILRCRRSLPDHPTSSLQALQGDALTPLAIAKAAAAGDLLARTLILETADWMARGIALTAHVIDPEIFMIGGAMNFGGDASPLGREFLDRIRKKTREMVFPAIAQHLKIEFASLGSDAGFIGAAGIARTGYLRGIPKAPPGRLSPAG